MINCMKVMINGERTEYCTSYIHEIGQHMIEKLEEKKEKQNDKPNNVRRVLQIEEEMKCKEEKKALHEIHNAIYTNEMMCQHVLPIGNYLDSTFVFFLSPSSSSSSLPSSSSPPAVSIACNANKASRASGRKCG